LITRSLVVILPNRAISTVTSLLARVILSRNWSLAAFIAGWSVFEILVLGLINLLYDAGLDSLNSLINSAIRVANGGGKKTSCPVWPDVLEAEDEDCEPS
jgi:hypothetical protein